MGKKIMLFLSAVLFLVSLGVFLFPTINRQIIESGERHEMEQFRQAIAQAQAQSAAPGERPFPELWDACTAYNRQLFEDDQEGFSLETIVRPNLNLAQYGWEPQSFGILTIPKIQVELPMYLGSSSENLRNGTAILGQTSLPIGGGSTNCVICGHRTWNGDDKLRDIDQLELGDEITVQNPWEVLNYRVVDIQVILPSEWRTLLIQPGRDLISIFTCTPIHVNTHRYLVIAERVK